MTNFILLIKGWSFKFANFLFGKTKIFVIIFGWFLIITGILFLVNPEKARKKLIRQGFGIFKFQLLIIAIYLALGIASVGFKSTLLLIHIITLAAIVVIIRLFFMLKQKSYNKLTEHFAKVPIKVLKIYAIIQIAIGVLMLILEKRIW